MSKRVVLVLAALLACGIAAFAGAGPASAVIGCDCGTAADTTGPLPPDQASALVAGGTETSGITATTAADPSAVVAAASASGADTAVAPDLTLAQAAGLDPSVAAASTSRCWTDQAWYQWGTWPYQQKIVDTTYWCALYGVKVTLRSSSVTGGGTICAISWRVPQLIGGGVGYPSFTERSSAGFSCPTVVPWIVLHPSHHLDVLRDATGGAKIIASG